MTSNTITFFFSLQESVTATDSCIVLPLEFLTCGTVLHEALIQYQGTHVATNEG